MTPITDKITNAKKIAIALADARDEKGYTIEGDAIRALVSDLEAKDKWRLALESFTPNGSEYVNDLPRCISFVREKFADRHEAKKEVVRLRRELEAKTRALEHYADELNWDYRGDAMTVYRYGNINETAGPTIAQAALKSE